ncbi:DNA polymerase III subunit gamma/tau [Candidatus Peregrinibacteria bacterium]|nr:DNA polymerase III subunit gamma/tau [Candidatus Peregrinibacteria bacterium]
MSLYLKYRPQNLKTVVGQGHIVVTLRNALLHNALTHAYLFSGPRGTGKTSFARILAKAINCHARVDGVEPCNECESCVAILNGRMVDLIEIDAASNRGIDEMRELKEKIQFSPTQGKAKVYIIDEVHMLTKEAFNALLKTLEEPPAHAFFILATTEVHKIPETILSRCQQFSFKRISEGDIIGRLGQIALEEKIQAEPEALALLARLSNGGLRDAIGLLEQMTIDSAIRYQDVVLNLGITGTMLIQAFFQALLDEDAGKAIEMIAQVNGMGQNLSQFSRELIAYLREQMLLGISAKGDVGKMVRLIEIFSEAKLLISSATIPQLPLEMAVIKACGYAVAPLPSHKPEAQVAAPKMVEKKMESAKTPVTASPEKAVELSVDDLSIDEIRVGWARFVEQVRTPVVRMSLADGEPLKMEKGSLHVAFKSNSLMERIANHANQDEVQSAFKTVFNRKVSLKLELKKISLEPVSTAKDPSAPSAVELANEVFGA